MGQENGIMSRPHTFMQVTFLPKAYIQRTIQAKYDKIKKKNCFQ